MTTSTPPLRSVLHFGPPKTGTTSLQAWCYANRDLLAAEGILYGEIETPHDPKHQWLMRELRSGDFTFLARQVEALKSGSFRTLILSCEGVAVHRRSIPAAHWQGFQEIMQEIDQTLFLVRRDQKAWLTSLWKQRLINPVRKGGRIPEGGPDDLALYPEVREMMDLARFSKALEQNTGARNTIISDMNESMLSDFKAVAGFAPHVGSGNLPIANEALPAACLSVYHKVATRTDDVGTVRLGFFALFGMVFPVSTTAISNIGRHFQKMLPDQRRKTIDQVIAAMDLCQFEDPSEKKLVETIRATAQKII